ncbi:threonine/serine ThrE exporter family protein [Granulicoccus sp. GXG6511]|uniref:threonine/serine ThrE exporter family protein n=1 Tax=Granulicoccus sp. GXG6511 TaxID=3381351 RepID=UPI003D7E878D
MSDQPAHEPLGTNDEQPPRATGPQDPTGRGRGPSPSRKQPQRGQFIRRARDVVRDLDAPTWGMDLRAYSDGVEQARSRSVIDLAMRIGDSTLSTGASSADVTAAIIAVTRAYGLRSVHVDVTFTSIAVTHHRGPFDDPVTMVRIVVARTPDYQRLAETHRLINDIARKELPLDDARAQFEEIMARPRLYRRSIVTLGFVVMAAGVCALLGGSPLEILLASVIVAIVDRASLWTARRRLPAFFGQIVGGAIPTAFAMVLVALRSYWEPMVDGFRPSILVATGIVVLLAGLAVVGAAQDAIDGYYVTASGRTFEVVILTLGILVGVLAVITVSFRLGVPAYLIPPATLASSLLVQTGAVIATAAGFALSGYSGGRTILVSCLLAVLGWLVYVLATELGFQSIVGTGFACVVVGFLAQPVAARLRVPALAITTSGIVAFLPGGMVYRGLYYLVEPGPAATAGTSGPSLLWGAAAMGLTIAGGISLGAYFGRFTARTHRAGARAKSKALARSTANSRE